MSEKARGKMRAVEQDDGAAGEEGDDLVAGEDDGALSEDLEKLRLSGLGNVGFVPTQEWVTSWQKGYVFLLSSVMCPLYHLPSVQLRFRFASP
jgi:hypothetical protein